MALACALWVLTAQAQSSLSVGFQKNIAFPIAGVTAAYSMDSTIAEASASNGVVEIYGKGPGTTHVIVVTSGGVQSLSVIVPQPPPSYPAGFVAPQPANAESGDYEFRYTSDPRQFTNSIDLKRVEGTSFTRLQVVNSNLISNSSGSVVGFPFASYEISRPQRDLVFLDDAVENSPLTLDKYTVRGFHLEQGPWIFHGGFTSTASFQGLFLATDPEKLAGISRWFRISQSNRLLANVYYFSNPASTRTIASDGGIASLLYEYKPAENISISSEAGVGRGVAFATRGKYDDLKDHLTGDFRFEPQRFPSLAINDQHGTFADLNGSRILSPRLEANLALNQSDYNLMTLRQNTFTESATLMWKASRNFSLYGGSGFSTFQSIVPLSSKIQTLELPLGINFSSRHFGAGAQYQNTTNFNGTGGNDFGGNLRGSVGRLQLSTFFQHDVQVPTVQAIFAQVPGLQDVLERSGIVATTPEEIAQLLRNTALLATLGFSNALTVDLAPARTDTGASLNWSGGGASRQRIDFSYLNSNTELVQGRLSFTTISASYSRRLNASNDVVATASLFRTQNSGASQLRPLFDISVQHRFYSVPGFLLPGRHGTISGHVFRDDEDAALFTGRQAGMPGVEVRLDDQRVTHTDAFGYYSFSRVPFGAHRVEAMFQSGEPFFYTTNSPATAEINSNVDFGINFAKGQIFGFLQNDAGKGIPEVVIELQGDHTRKTIRTSSDGKFSFAGLAPGSYTVSTLAETYPAGYSLQNLPAQQIAIEAGAPGKSELTVRAIRSISGKVIAYDSKLLQTVPLAGLSVRLVELSLETKTGDNGAYIFRNLPPGRYTISTTYEGKEITHSVELTPDPILVRDADLNAGTK